MESSYFALDIYQKTIVFNLIYPNRISEKITFLIYRILMYVINSAFRLQYVKIQFRLSTAAGNGVLPSTSGYAIIVTKKILSISSDGQRYFGLL